MNETALPPDTHLGHPGATPEACPPQPAKPVVRRIKLDEIQRAFLEDQTRQIEDLQKRIMEIDARAIEILSRSCGVEGARCRVEHGLDGPHLVAVHPAGATSAPKAT